MKYKILLLGVFSSFLFSGVENEKNYIPYYNATNIASKYYDDGEYLNSFKIYDSLFKEYKPLNRVIVYEYEEYLLAAYKANRKEVIRPGVKKLISEFGITLKELAGHKEKSLLLDYSNISNAEYSTLRKKYLSKINLELRDTIVELIRRDQLYRRNYDKEDKNAKIDSVDAINEKILVDVFDNYGYPNKELIGTNNVQEGFQHTILSAALLHTKDSIRRSYFLPKILEFVKKGDCGPFIYARMVDQLEIYNNRPQIYGSYYGSPIKDSANINAIRKSIGLSEISF